MELFVSECAGFCFGVKRAVDRALDEAKKGKTATFGELIHNKHVISDLKALGVDIHYEIDGTIEAGRTLILRSHGVHPKIYRKLEELGIQYIDCTCPCVKNIHKLVSKDFENGYNIIIMGEKAHPEIIGINGYANDMGLVINSLDELEKTPFIKCAEYSVVAQTTLSSALFDILINEMERLAKEIGFELKTNFTLCDSTIKRYREAEEISKKVDKMIVIGDDKSSNTLKLFEICKKNCKNTFLIQSINDLQLNIFSQSDRIGITAGASTPPAIIKEAVTQMSELEQNNGNAENFEEMLNESLITLHTGDIVKGTVIQVVNGEVSVNLGFKSDGIIIKGEFSEDPNVDPAKVVKPGDEIEVFVVRVNDGDGNVLLSKKKIELQKGFEELSAAFEEKTPVKGKVTEVVKGGLIAIISGTRAFIPSSQISNRFVEDLNVFVGQEFNFNILEFEKAKRRLVVGRRELATKEMIDNKNKLYETIQVGQRIEGKVNRIVDFGAFVELGGVDGLIHISELSWSRVRKVKDVLKEGDSVTVTVLEIDKEKDKISLSLKDVNSDPWNSVAKNFPIGSVVKGKVVRTAPFGAFVELSEGVDGLVHISQIAEKHVVKPEDELSVGQIIDVKVTDIDLTNKKVSLSKKQADAMLRASEEKTEEQIEERNPEEQKNTETEEATSDTAAIETEEVTDDTATGEIEVLEEVKEEEAIEEAEAVAELELTDKNTVNDN